MPPASSLWKGSLGGILAPRRYSTPSTHDAQSIQSSTMPAPLTCTVRPAEHEVPEVITGCGWECL